MSARHDRVRRPQPQGNTANDDGTPVPRTPKRHKPTSYSSAPRTATSSLFSPGNPSAPTGTTPIKNILKSLKLDRETEPLQEIVISSDESDGDSFGSSISAIANKKATPRRQATPGPSNVTPRSRKRDQTARALSPSSQGSPGKIRKLDISSPPLPRATSTSSKKPVKKDFPTYAPSLSLRSRATPSAGTSRVACNIPKDVFYTGPESPDVPMADTSDGDTEPDEELPTSQPHKESTPSYGSFHFVSYDEVSDISGSEQSFIGRLFSDGVQLPICIISHNTDAQKMLDAYQIPWGVQFTLAAGQSAGLWTWDDVLTKVKNLADPGDETLGKIDSVMLGRPTVNSPEAFKIAKQLRLEQEALLENCGRGMGLMGTFHGETNWYGGRVQQIAKVVEEEKGRLRIALRPLTERKSTRFARFLGSRRIIQLSADDKLLRNSDLNIKEFFKQRFVLCGRVFVPWVSKEGSLYLVEGNEDFERESGEWCGDHLRKSYAEIFEWHNPPALNAAQPMAKYVTRNVLGLSTSVPGIMFEDSNIVYIGDEVGSNCKDPSNASASELMTDGCGFMNREAFKRLTVNLGLAHIPTAVQGRIAGDKGLWIPHPTNFDEEPKIWIRKSQHKIKHKRPYPQSLRILDVVSTGNPPSAVTLSTQSIMNLAHNGIPHKVFVRLMREGLERLIRPLTTDGIEGMLPLARLWSAVNQVNHVTGTRVQRHASGLERVLGLRRRDFKDGDGDVADDAASSGRNAISGQPGSLGETVIELLQAGFQPGSSALLHEKMRNLIKKTIESATLGYHIPLEDGTSIDAFVIPDPTHKLKPGQVFYHSSQPLVNPDTRTLFNVPVGPAVIGRYPIRLPSDIQQIEVVDVPELRDLYKDVIVISVQGTESLMTKLSGGDFDGDTAFLIWQEDLVKGFKNKPLCAQPENFMEKYFERSVQSVEKFGAALKPTEKCQKTFVETLLTGMTTGSVGMYSTFHDYAAWKFGLGSSDAILLAYMFNTLLDSGKTGFVSKQGVFLAHQKAYGRRRPLCLNRSNSREASSVREGAPFVLDVLMDHGLQIAARLQVGYAEQKPTSTNQYNLDLCRQWTDLVQQCCELEAHPRLEQRLIGSELRTILLCIKEHVQDAYIEWRQAVGKQSSTPSPSKGSGREKKEDITLRAMKMYAAPLADTDCGFLPLLDVDKLRAACAYCEDFDKPEDCEDVYKPTLGIRKRCQDGKTQFVANENFAFSMAHQTLCVMMAQSSAGGIAASVREVDDLKGMTGAARKLLDALPVAWD